MILIGAEQVGDFQAAGKVYCDLSGGDTGVCRCKISSACTIDEILHLQTPVSADVKFHQRVQLIFRPHRLTLVDLKIRRYLDGKSSTVLFSVFLKVRIEFKCLKVE